MRLTLHQKDIACAYRLLRTSTIVVLILTSVYYKEQQWCCSHFAYRTRTSLWRNAINLSLTRRTKDISTIFICCHTNRRNPDIVSTKQSWTPWSDQYLSDHFPKRCGLRCDQLRQVLDILSPKPFGLSRLLAVQMPRLARSCPSSVIPSTSHFHCNVR